MFLSNVANRNALYLVIEMISLGGVQQELQELNI